MVSAAGPMLANLGATDAPPDATQLQGFISRWKQQMALALFLTGAPGLAAFRRVKARLDGPLITP
jgi:isopentenyl diphosphate isomerase/L-lactate dehydrogenase-like FMN-dependent dehydrogenase